MERNFLSPGQTRRWFLELNPEFISGLVEREVRSWTKPPQLKNFFAAEDHFPLAIKFRGEGRPGAGETYRVHIYLEFRREFLDQNGKYCRSRDRVVVRIYPHDHAKDPQKPQGELNFSACGKDEQVFVHPKPLLWQPIQGKERNGYLWIAESETEYRLRRRDQQDEIIFKGGIVVMLANFERELVGARAVDLALENGVKLTVYDRRQNRFSPYAQAEHIRRTLGRGKWARSFEFINLRDLPRDELAESPPRYVLRETGLEPVEGLA